MAGNSILHPRDRLPKEATRINLEQGRFFISVEEFEARLNEICCELWKITRFAKFAVNNLKKIEGRRLVQVDIKVFVDFLSVFINLLIQKACLKKLADSSLLNFF